MGINSEILFVSSRYRFRTVSLIINNELPFTSSRYLARTSQFLINNETTFQQAYGMTVGGKVYMATFSIYLSRMSKPSKELGDGR